MSMLTRCPGCGTSFRITTDQLVSRQGKVRCGNCQQIFSALGSLVHTRDAAVHPPAVEPAAAREPAKAAPAPMPAAGAASIPAPGPASIPMEPEPAFAQAVEPAGEEVLEPAREPARAAFRPAVDDDEDQAPRRRFPWLSFVGVLLATTMLAAQGAYFYRDQLALIEPDTKPYLLQMCARLNCKIEMPADPQAIGIESSSLEADPADKTLMQMTALLRNRSALAQNLPYLELTLLDSQEAPLARRVLRPEDYAGAKPGPLAPDSEYQVKVGVDAAQLKASGYRLYAFYP